MPWAPVVLTMTAPTMPVVVMMVAAETLTQMHDGSACRGGGFLRHIGGLRRHGKGGDDGEHEHRAGPGGGAMALDE